MHDDSLLFYTRKRHLQINLYRLVRYISQFCVHQSAERHHCLTNALKGAWQFASMKFRMSDRPTERPTNQKTKDVITFLQKTDLRVCKKVKNPIKYNLKYIICLWPTRFPFPRSSMNGDLNRYCSAMKQRKYFRHF